MRSVTPSWPKRRSCESSRAELPALQVELAELQSHVVKTRERPVLQEVGVYQYRHPLDDAPAYKAKLAEISDAIKAAVKAGTAVSGSQNWTVNGSKPEGARMVKEFSKLMLHAYNNEADNAVRSMKPYALDSAIASLTKAKETISKLGKTMSITVTDRYHALRVAELAVPRISFGFCVLSFELSAKAASAASKSKVHAPSAASSPTNAVLARARFLPHGFKHTDERRMRHLLRRRRQANQS